MFSLSFATIRGWIGWLIVLYCVAMCTDWLTGTILAIKNAEWNSSKAREGLWHKCGSIFCLAVALLTDLLLSLIVNNIPGMQLTFQYKVMLFPLVTVWYILSELGSILENAAEMGAPIPLFSTPCARKKFKIHVRVLTNFKNLKFVSLLTNYCLFLLYIY